MEKIDCDKLVDFKEIQKLTKIDKKNILERTLKLSEESGEVAQAVLSYTNACGCGYKSKTNKDVIEECIDVIIVASSIICQSSNEDMNLCEVEKIYKSKLCKWKEKCENN